ncbi:MAG: hypothetical protein M0Z43_13495 [Acidithiobacillus sp.]|nr:hypothetical protein [Acidithiobacillus sp.]
MDTLHEAKPTQSRPSAVYGQSAQAPRVAYRIMERLPDGRTHVTPMTEQRGIVEPETLAARISARAYYWTRQGYQVLRPVWSAAEYWRDGFTAYHAALGQLVTVWLEQLE